MRQLGWFSAGGWKPLHFPDSLWSDSIFRARGEGSDDLAHSAPGLGALPDAHWGSSEGGFACEPAPAYSPDPRCSLRLLPYAGADVWGRLRWAGGWLGGDFVQRTKGLKVMPIASVDEYQVVFHFVQYSVSFRDMAAPEPMKPVL